MRTLKSKFILIICSVYVIIGSLTLIAFYLGTDKIIRDFGTKFAVRQALLEKNKVLAVIDREVALAQKLADDPVLREWCARETDAALKKTAFEQLDSYRKFFRDKSYFIAMKESQRYYVYDTNKRKVDILRLDEQNPKDRWFFTALAKADPFILNLDYSPIVNATKVWINVIMKDEKGQKIGVGGSGIDISEFIAEIIRSQDKGLSGILIDRAGIIQAHENKEYVRKNANAVDDAGKLTLYSLMDKEPDRTSLARAIELLTAGKSEVETFLISLNQTRYLVALAYMPGIQWYNLALVDVSQVSRIINFVPIMAIIVLSLFLMLLIMALTLNKVVLRPLSILTRASRQVAAGQYGISLPVTRRDEIGQLTASFNHMTATVLDYTQNLENKVVERTADLSKAHQELQQAQKQVIDSINYARLIQSSILPGASIFDDYLKEYFILYQPRDIVGGDFYYFRSLGDRFIVAVIDCTGHGVPGALITMTVNAVLNYIPDSVWADSPGRALQELHHLIRHTLNHDASTHLIDSGLDIGLCLGLPQEKQVLFAGAGISLYVAYGPEVQEIKGDRKRLGYKGSRPGLSFTNHLIPLEEGMGLYLTTDGILDQGGGPKGFSLGRERFMELIKTLHDLPMPEQRRAYGLKFDEYRGGIPQRDDILLFGFTVMLKGENQSDA